MASPLSSSDGDSTVPRVIEPSFVAATRVAYDTVAVSYAEILRDELSRKPTDRAMLALFAELVVGSVADIGCGPGRVTAHLRSLGLTAFGIDLSPRMVAVARETHPALRFEVGSMMDLPLADGSVGGVVAWYSIIHTPLESLPVVFAEFSRVLVPGGQLLLAFQVGDERKRITDAYGHEGLSLDAYRLLPDRVGELLGQAGFIAHARLVRDPEGLEKTQQAYLLARKP